MISLPPPLRLHFKEQTGSTNDDAMALAEKGAADLTIVWALTQTKGRGRLNRPWASGGGNLHWTALVRLQDGLRHLEGLAFIVALAVAETVEDLLPHGANLRCKWPNDVLVNERKVSGALIEGSYDSGWVVVGVGINLGHTPEIPDAVYQPTSLRAEGSDATLEQLCLNFSTVFLRRLTAWRDHGLTEDDRAEYVRKLHNLGKETRVSFDARKSVGITGINRGIDDQFNLLLELADGRMQKVYAGDVLPPLTR